MGEVICKQSNWQGINLQNMQTTYADQYQTIQSKHERKISPLSKDIQMAEKHVKRCLASLIIR